MQRSLSVFAMIFFTLTLLAGSISAEPAAVDAAPGARPHIPQALTATTGITTRVSVASDGTQGNKSSLSSSSVSADGRYVAFRSAADNLVPDDINDAHDIFIHDTVTGDTSRVSVASDGTQGNGSSESPSISADGRYVTFTSNASNLLEEDSNDSRDIFIHDRVTGETERVSVSSEGTQANDFSLLPKISADGRFVTFVSYATNLVEGDTNGWRDIFLRDLETGRTTRVSVASDGQQGDFSSYWPSLSSDGRYVAFYSRSSNLVADDMNASGDIFIHDTADGSTTRVSLSSDGAQANSNSDHPEISADGRFVAFRSSADNLVPDDTNGFLDIFVHDTETGLTTRVSVSSDGTQGNGDSLFSSISTDGRFVAFDSRADNLVVGDSNEDTDVFLHDRMRNAETAYSIAGRITDQNGNPIPGVALSSNAGHSAISHTDGNYNITDVPTGTYTVTPTLTGIAFTPTSRTVTVPPAAEEVDFVGESDCLSADDGDNDGIPDGWERCGYYHRRPPVGEPDVDLPAIGADPEIPDIFVEIDYMWAYDEDGNHVGHSHQPKPEAIKRVVDAFAEQGIHLHIDWGPLAELRWGDDLIWGAHSDGEKLAHREFLTTEDWFWDGFDTIKWYQGHFGSERERIFHYAIFSHKFSENVNRSVLGLSRNESAECHLVQNGATDFVLGLGNFDESWIDNAVWRQAGVFMHELGHNLGLCEGGNDDLEYKPNYLSVMNYSFMERGLIIDGEEGHIDYSRFGSAVVPPLVEWSLDERAGLNSDAVEKYGTRYYCRSDEAGWSNEYDEEANLAIDWNCSGDPPWGVVEANINDGNEEDEDPGFDTLYAFNDWENLKLDVFDGEETGVGSPTSSSLPSLVHRGMDEPEELAGDVAQNLDSPYAVALGSSSAYVASPGLGTTIPITVANSGTMTAAVTFSHTVASWFDLSTIPMTVTLEPNATRSYEVGLSVPATAVAGSEQRVTTEAYLNESPLMSDLVVLEARVGPMAWFEAEPAAGATPHTVVFQDNSVGEITAWLWDFGDGSQSTQPNPTHVYAAPGVYTVSLTVTGPSGTDVYARMNLIRVDSNRSYLPSIQTSS